MPLRAFMCLTLVAAIVACASSGRITQPKEGSWFSKQGAFDEDLASRRRLVGMWRSEATDIHAIRRIEESTRNADGTYENHFLEIAESGKVSSDRMECGRWGISGDVYFTITLAMREDDGQGSPTSPYNASFYDAYRVQKLTDTEFKYQHVVSGQLSSETKVGSPPARAALRGQADGSSPCIGAAT